MSSSGANSHLVEVTLFVPIYVQTPMTYLAQPPFYSIHQSYLATPLIIIMSALPSLDTCGLDSMEQGSAFGTP